MSEAFVFDAVRTPRGKGKKDGSLHEVKPGTTPTHDVKCPYLIHARAATASTAASGAVAPRMVFSALAEVVGLRT